MMRNSSKFVFLFVILLLHNCVGQKLTAFGSKLAKPKDSEVQTTVKPVEESTNFSDTRGKINDIALNFAHNSL